MKRILVFLFTPIAFVSLAAAAEASLCSRISHSLSSKKIGAV